MIRAGQHLGSISSTCARWATVALVFAVFLLLMLVGCSRTHIAKVVSEKWDVGQHQRCFYGQGATLSMPLRLQKLPSSGAVVKSVQGAARDYTALVRDTSERSWTIIRRESSTLSILKSARLFSNACLSPEWRRLAGSSLQVQYDRCIEDG